MRETDQVIQELYIQYKVSQLPAHQPLLRIIGGVTKLLGRQRITREEKTKQIKRQIEGLVKDRIGRYPLARMSYIPGMAGSGFEYGFDYTLGEDVFAVDYWSYNHWGILVQKHPSDFIPEIEIVERTLEPTEEELEEDPNVGPYTTIDRLLHLPEGFKIPVGPLRFESDSLPLSEEELAANKARAIKIAKAAGIKVNKDILEIADKFSGPARNYPDRYFYWQPILPDNPTEIAIDFDSIEPYHMGLIWKSAPTFSNTLVITDKDF